MEFPIEPAGTASWKVWADTQADAYKILVESFAGARVRPRAYISWQSDPLRGRVHRESTPTEYTGTVHRHSGRENRRESAVHIEFGYGVSEDRLVSDALSLNSSLVTMPHG